MFSPISPPTAHETTPDGGRAVRVELVWIAETDNANRMEWGNLGKRQVKYCVRLSSQHEYNRFLHSKV